MTRKTYVLLLLVLCVAVLTGVVSAEGATEVDDVDDLQNVSDDLSGDYVLVDDIDMSTVNNFEPIGDRDEPFTGSFDGGGNVIEGLTVRQPSSELAGLFAETGDEAVVRDLTVTDATVTGGGVASGLVAHHRGSIVGVNVTGEVSGEARTGGLVGVSQGEIHRSHTAGQVSGDIEAGGLVGETTGGEITESGSSAEVTGTAGSGGLVGRNVGAEITESYATGDVTAEMFSAGGLVGSNDDGNLSESYAKGDVSGGTNVGGLVGENNADTSALCPDGDENHEKIQPASISSVGNGTVTESYSVGNVTGDENVGGIAGINSGTVADSYVTGRVVGDESVGGLVGINRGVLTTSYVAGAATGDGKTGALVGDDAGCGTELYWLAGVGETAFGTTEEETEATCLRADEARDYSAVDSMSELGFTEAWEAGTGSEGYPGLSWHSDRSDRRAEASGEGVCPEDYDAGTDTETETDSDADSDSETETPMPGFTTVITLLAFVAVVIQRRTSDSR